MLLSTTLQYLSTALPCISILYYLLSGSSIHTLWRMLEVCGSPDNFNLLCHTLGMLQLC